MNSGVYIVTRGVCYLSAFERDDLGVVGRTDDRVVTSDARAVADVTEELFTVSGSVGEVLPRLPRLTVVIGPLQREHSRPRRVGHLDEYVCHVELLHTYQCIFSFKYHFSFGFSFSYSFGCIFVLVFQVRTQG